MRRLALAAILTAVTAISVAAQSAGQPTFVIGDRWKNSNGGEAQVIKVNDTGVVMVRPKSRCPTCSWVYDRDLTLVQILDAEGKPTDTSKFRFLWIGFKFLDFPLEVKKTWSVEGYALFSGDHVLCIVTSRVSALEDVKTKAGNFQAYRIDRVFLARVHSGVPPSWKDTIWYAPDVKAVVKFEGSTQGWELESRTLSQ